MVSDDDFGDQILEIFEISTKSNPTGAPDLPRSLTRRQQDILSKKNEILDSL